MCDGPLSWELCKVGLLPRVVPSFKFAAVGTKAKTRTSLFVSFASLNMIVLAVLHLPHSLLLLVSLYSDPFSNVYNTITEQ